MEKDTLNLLSIISSGEYLINGFSNKLIRAYSNIIKIKSSWNNQKSS